MALAEVLKVNQETEPMHHGPLVLNMRRANMQETVHERLGAMNVAVACLEHVLNAPRSPNASMRIHRRPSMIQ